jgi:hypothetical protein
MVCSVSSSAFSDIIHVLASYEFRVNRKALQPLLNSDVMGQYLSQIQKETVVLLKDLLDEPQVNYTYF